MFKVSPLANKNDIKEFVETYFKVNVEKVGPPISIGSEKVGRRSAMPPRRLEESDRDLEKGSRLI